ncbi:MAG: homoserine kinase [Clostridia bacterium]|nr:homoserine kinase [Clostridia bacterium]
MVKCTVRVPATTANLGPGFDCVGCAFTLYNTLTFTLTDEALSFSGCDEKYANAENLAFIGFRDVFSYLSLPTPGVHISFDQISVPVSRGLGSSAALIVAGSCAANFLSGNKLSKEQLLAICNKIEGHPDNLSPAIYGGLTASVTRGDNAYSVRYGIHPSLRFVALVPDFELLTSLARSVLPKEIAFKDAVFNTSHLAVLLKALETGDKALISLALDDKLHQPYRRALIKGYDQAEAFAKELGALAFCLSGAGPTCLCLTDSDGFAEKMEEKLRSIGLNWQVLSLPVDTEGAKII